MKLVVPALCVVSGICWAMGGLYHSGLIMIWIALLVWKIDVMEEKINAKQRMAK